MTSDQLADLPTPERPANLKADGGALWDGVITGYELRVDEIVLLEAACRELDLIAGMQAQIDAAISVGDWLVKGSMGQEVAHPLIGELRQHRVTLSGLLKRLGLDAADAERDGKQTTWTRSEIGRHAARARWDRSS